MQFGNIYKYPFYRYNVKDADVFVPHISEYKYTFIAINTCE